MKFKTAALQSTVLKAIKGSGNSPALPVTSSICIEVVGTDLVFTTTNASHNLEVKIAECVPVGTTFYAATDADLFGKLVSKITTEYTEISLQENALQITGNGIYNLPLLQDEEGSMAKIQPIEVSSEKQTVVKMKDLKKVLNYNSLSVAKTYEEPKFTGYCFTDKGNVYTYDSVKFCIAETGCAIEALIPNALLQLCKLIEDKTVTVSQEGEKIKIEASNITITGTVLEGYAEYPAQQLHEAAFNTGSSSSLKVTKQSLIDALDRLSLFVDTEDQNALTIAVHEDRLILANKSSNAFEEVKVMEAEGVQELSSCVDLNDLKVVAASMPNDVITLVHGNQVSLNVHQEGLDFVIPFLNDEEEVEEDEVLESDSGVEQEGEQF